MGIKFTDPRLYVKGIGSAVMRDPGSGDITYYSDKFQNGQITPSADAGEINAGLGNGLATMISTNARVAVNFTAADFNLFAKSAAVGSNVTYGAPVLVCQMVTADSAVLKVDVSEGTPVAGLGMSKAVGYVQIAGAAAPLAQTGTAYEIDAATGEVKGYNAVIGTTYKVWYFASRANAQLAPLTSNMNGKVQHFTAEFAVYCNVNTNTLEGTRWGTLYCVVPNLKLSVDGAALNGDQTSNTTTGIVGQSLMYDEEVISDKCDACGDAGSVMAYYLLVPCDGTIGITGLALVGGVLTVAAGSTHAINEFRLVMDDTSLAIPDAAKMSYELVDAPTGTSVTGSVITAGETAGDCTIKATYTEGGETVGTEAVLSVKA